MKKTIEANTILAQKLIDGFLSRTGITGKSGNVKRRYLWTDAFAVQSCFALSHILKQESYNIHALKLISQVHNILGKHREDDAREGWISGLPDDEGQNHPTVNGLRIGKKMPERKLGEIYNQQQEWDRDGQYFHYLTRWFNALLLAFTETGETKYATWATELLKAGEKFLIKKKNSVGMAWKMNIDLTHPLVDSMGAHDPLEALICIYRAGIDVPNVPVELVRMHNAVEMLCRDMNWFTYDPLGIGGLLLSTKRSCELVLQGKSLPAAIRPEYLFAGARAGLKTFAEQVYDAGQTDKYRLGFRECGLALGVYALYGMKEIYQELDVNVNKLESHIPLVQEIIDFWSEPSNRTTTGWHAHEDINEIMLAAGLLSVNYPQSY